MFGFSCIWEMIDLCGYSVFCGTPIHRNFSPEQNWQLHWGVPSHFFWGFYRHSMFLNCSDFSISELVWGHVCVVVFDRSKFCLSLSVYLLFYLFFFLYASFVFTVACTCGFYWDIHVYTRVFCTQLRMPWVLPFWGRLSVVGWVLMIAESPWMLLESVYTSVSDQRCFLV